MTLYRHHQQPAQSIGDRVNEFQIGSSSEGSASGSRFGESSYRALSQRRGIIPVMIIIVAPICSPVNSAMNSSVVAVCISVSLINRHSNG